MATAEDLMTSDFIKLDINDMISSFLGAIKKTGDTFGLIFDGKSYLGFADKKELLRTRVDFTKTKVKHCLKHVPILTPKSSLADVVRLMATADVRALPVRADKKIVGVVRAKDLAKELEDFYKNIRVEDVIKKKVVVCDEDDELGKVMTQMTQKNVDRVPIVGRDGKIIGLITIVDILLKYLMNPSKGVKLTRAASHSRWRLTGFQVGERQDLLKCPASNHMSTNFKTCAMNCNVLDAIEIMENENVSSLVVVENQKPIGMITFKDLFEYYRKRQ